MNLENEGIGLQKAEGFFILGFILILVGSAILLLQGETTGIFFVFPFFFFGNIDGTTGLILTAVVTVLFILFMVNLTRIGGTQLRGEEHKYKTCPKCYSMIQNDALFCSYCGYSLEENQQFDDT